MISPFHICTPKAKFILITAVALFLLSAQYLFFNPKWLKRPIVCTNQQPLNDPTLAQTDFQLISAQPGHKISMYSAYFDPSLNVIKVIGGARIKSWYSWRDTVLCEYYNERQHMISIRSGTVVLVEQSTDLPYGAAFILCELQDCEYPTYVSISSAGGQQQRRPHLPNLFHIQYHQPSTPPPVEFSVCVQPAFAYENPLHFVEWIEYYQLLGVQGFMLYNISIGPITSCIINIYKQQPELDIQVLPWTLDFKPFEEFFHYGQLVQVNDCIYRARGKAKYVVNVDFDEFIVPRDADNFTQLIQQIHDSSGSSLGSSRTSAFIFLNGFFYTNENQEASRMTGTKSTKPSHLLIGSKFIRVKELNPAYERTKYIANPRLVDEAGAHYIYSGVDSSRMHVVPPDIAYLHHYRWTVPDTIGNVNSSVIRSATETEKPVIISANDKTRVVDKSADRFTQKVSDRIRHKLGRFKNECGFEFQL